MPFESHVFLWIKFVLVILVEGQLAIIFDKLL